MKRHSPQLYFPAFLLALAAWPLLAKVVQVKLPPETESFKPGPGSDLANGQCLTCHSVEYVTTQPPMPRAFWVGELEKMRQSYGAPIPDDQVIPLVDYLTRNYGAGTNVAPPSIASPAVSPPAIATSSPPLAGQAIAARYGCLGCHNVNVKIVGPSYKDIAAKYGKETNAYARIGEQIHKGGSGKWGSVIMPPFPTATGPEVEALAAWILSCK